MAKFLTVGSYSSTKWFWINCIVRADLPAKEKKKREINRNAISWWGNKSISCIDVNKRQWLHWIVTNCRIIYVIAFAQRIWMQRWSVQKHNVKLSTMLSDAFRQMSRPKCTHQDCTNDNKMRDYANNHKKITIAILTDTTCPNND